MRLDDMLRNVGADAAIVAAPENIRYISGFTGEGYLVVVEDGMTIVTDSRYTVQASMQSDAEVVTIDGSRDHFSSIADILESHDVKKAAFEDNFWTCAMFDLMRLAAGSVEFVKLGRSLDFLRMEKTEDELSKIRRACKIGDEAFSEMLGIYHAGMTEIDAAWRLERAMREKGASRMSFDPIVASGENGAMPHAIPSDRAFKQGDLVVMDFGCVFEGYCSDMTRTIAIGEPNAKCREIYEVTLKAQLAGLGALKPDVSGSSVDRVSRNVITNAGYGDFFGHGLGHGVGLMIHELPRLTRGVEGGITLKPGHVVSVEPGIYLPGVAGVRIEDLCVVTSGGCETMTHSPKELIVL